MRFVSALPRELEHGPRVALGSDGEPRVAFSDRSSLFYAVHDADGWAVEEVVSAASLPLGQLVSLKVDAANAPHIAYYEVTRLSPLSGVIGYLTKLVTVARLRMR